MFAVLDLRLDSHPLVVVKRVEDVNDVELRLALGIVHGGDVHAVVEQLVLAHAQQDLVNDGAVHDQVLLSKVGVGFFDSGTILTAQPRDQLCLPGLWLGTFRLWRRLGSRGCRRLGAQLAAAAGFSPVADGSWFSRHSGLRQPARLAVELLAQQRLVMFRRMFWRRPILLPHPRPQAGPSGRMVQERLGWFLCFRRALLMPL